MLKLELKIPPPIIMLLSGLMAFLISGRDLNFLLHQANASDNIIETLIWPLVLLFAGIAIAVSGVLEFKRHQTTISPLNPHRSSRIVSNGIFGFSRNPMYLGMLLVLLGWADFLDNFIAFAGALFFILYITKFQIQAEERILLENFKGEYQEYMDRVRRWL